MRPWPLATMSQTAGARHKLQPPVSSLDHLTSPRQSTYFNDEVSTAASHASIRHLHYAQPSHSSTIIEGLI